jgi:hypothetical protein
MATPELDKPSVKFSMDPSAPVALGTLRTDGLRRFLVPVKLCCMKRELTALILMLVIGLQGSVAAFAATSPLMSTACQTTAMDHSDASQDSCCPKGQRAMSCCLDLCLSTVGATVSPIALTWFTPPSELMATKPAIFSSRGDSPLIRPPIL